MKFEKDWFRCRWRGCLWGVIAMFASASYVIREPGSDWTGAGVMLALAGVMLFDALDRQPDGEAARFPAWLLLATTILLCCCCPETAPPLFHQLLLLMFFTAAACRLAGLSVAMRMLPACSVLLIVIPFRSALVLHMSYPLRLVSTHLATDLLKLFDATIVRVRTTVMLSDTRIAVTDACSGIAQAEAMLLLAYLAVRRRPCAVIWKILHYLFLFPAIMLANAIRIALTVWLYKLFGEVVFRDVVHVALGYLQVIAAMAFFLAAGLPLPKRKTGSEVRK